MSSEDLTLPKVVDISSLREWVGKREIRSDRITHFPVAALSATLDREDPFSRDGEVLPPLWHWLYFLPLQRQSEIGSDGHAKRGTFLPPVPLPHRMFAGGRVEWLHPLRLGDAVSRTSHILDVNHKEGRSGELVFVKVSHETSNTAGLAVNEEWDIVFRGKVRPGESKPAPQTAPTDAEWSRRVRPDEVLLFRYSALTFNSHRIHYDRRYATEVEGHPGLVVHGPLIATLLLDLLRRNFPDAKIAKFSFRAIKPLFDTGHFVVSGRLDGDGKTCRLWAADPQGYLATDATAVLA
jgi:3-methylfumaryl-CoA hydratase